MKRSIFSGLQMAEALFHQDWIKQYEFMCWGFSRKKKSDDNSDWQGFPIHVRADVKEKDLQIYTETGRTEVLSDYCSVCSFSSETTVSGGCWKWARSTFWNQKLLKVEKLQAVNSSYCSAAHCFTQTAWGDPGMHGNECNKEGICQVAKTVKDQTFFFWQGEKWNPKNIWKTKKKPWNWRK